MGDLNREELKKLKGLLREEKKEILRHLEEAGAAEGESLADASGEISSYDNHPADLATETADRERDLAIDGAFRERLDAVDRALARMRDGEYGKCETCGKPIPYERLEAIPWTPFCVEHSRSPADSAKPDTAAPAGSAKDEQPDLRFDDDAGAWRAVEAYGDSDSMTGR